MIQNESSIGLLVRQAKRGENAKGKRHHVKIRERRDDLACSPKRA